MNKIVFLAGCLVMLISTSAHADSFLRIKCDDNDIGTEVYLNGKFVGNCPVDAPAAEGTVELRARKTVDADHEQIFRRELRVVDGVPQRIELTMSPVQLTTEARLRKEIAEASNQLRAAESGEVAAMKKIAEYFDGGIGVTKDPAKAKLWRDKAEASIAQDQLRAANAGSIQAMENMAARYGSGLGVNKDDAQARSWSEKAGAAKREKIAQAEAAKREQIAQERNRAKQAKIDSISYFERTGGFIRDLTNNGRNAGTSELISVATISPVSLLTDLTIAPTKSTEINDIKNEAALRPSTWGKPDSLIARTSVQFKNPPSKPEDKLIIAASK